jgi:hypothetical protein
MKVLGRNLFWKWSLCVADPRLQGLMMDPHRLALMGCRTAETKYWRHLQNRMWEVLHGFKDADTMLSINELHI